MEWKRVISTGMGATLGSYLFVGRTPAFVGTPVSRFVTNITPGEIVTIGIEKFGSIGQIIAFAIAIVLTVILLGGIIELCITAINSVTDQQLVQYVGASVILGIGIVLFTMSPASGLGVALFSLAAAPITDILFSAKNSRVDNERRSFLQSLSGTALVSGGIGAIVNQHYFNQQTESVSLSEKDESKRMVSAATEASFDVEGLEPLNSTDFFEVDIASVNPDISSDDWSLSITGDINQEMELSYDDIQTKYSSENRYISLQCVGDSLNGKKLDSAVWTGVPLESVLDNTSISGTHARLEANDGYYQVFPVEALERGFLAYGMNGKTLPRGHGYPVRILIPGHWGEINVKWLTNIEFISQDEKGYWEKRGWHGTGPVNTVAKLWAKNKLPTGELQVAGHAYAGLRGISKVEVSVDAGQSWNEADLTEELPGEDVWRQWKYEYGNPAREHRVVVRAYDSDGVMQTQEEASAFPNGPTGWVSEVVNPSQL